MPFHLRNAKHLSKAYANNVGDQQCQTLFLYLDDIIVFSSSVVQHLQRLEVVLSRLAVGSSQGAGASGCMGGG